jgi:uncharacterized protein (TIGR03083 family)
MVAARSLDCAKVYERKRCDLLELMGSLTETELAVVVPATPEWSVLDVLAHVVGVAADMNAGNYGTADTADAWTAAQVRSRRGASLADLEAEWDREAPTFAGGLRLFDYEFSSHYVGDLLQHTGDVHHAARRPRPADDDGLVVALDFYLSSFEQTLTSAGIGAVDVNAADEHWTLGVGETIASVTGDRYELFRCLGGRRSEAQVRALHWEGDIDVALPLMSRYPLQARPILETALNGHESDGGRDDRTP